MDFKKVLNPNYNTAARPVPIAYWKIKQKDIVLVNTATAIDTSLVRLDLIKAIAINEIIAIINFKNAGEYTLQAYTYIGDQSPLIANFTVLDSLSINTVKAESNALLRYNDVLKVSVDKFNVDNVFNDGTKAMQWYLQKDGVQLSLFEQSAVSKKSTINKRIDQIIYNDAQAGNNYFGKYAIEAYGKALENPKKPTFKGADTYFFEVVKNRIESLVIPPKVPKGAIVNCETTARIMPLVSGEAFQIEVPQGVTKNSDGSLMFSELGEYEITAQLTGAYTDNKKITQKIKVADPVLKKALWAYGTGYKRTQTGYKEDTHAFVEIAGLENQTITIKVWLRGDGDSFYLQPDKYMLEEKKVTLNDKGKGSFMITTSDKYKEKIEKAIPPTVAMPNPSYRLVFTVEMPTGKQGAVTLPANMNLVHGTKIENTNLYEVLDANEELELTNEKRIKSIVFSTEDGKDVQQGITFYGKTHKIWVHTVNMIDDELKVEVFKEVPIDNLTETQNIIYTHESKETYKEEKVGSDGLLELSFTPKEEWNITCKNIDYYVASVSMKVKDEQNCDVWKVMSTQVRTNDSFPVSLEYDKEREKMGIKAVKEDGTPFTKEEMETLRGKFIQYIQGALKVSPYSEIAPEVKQGAPLVVEMGEIEKKKIKNCYCDKDLTEEEVKDLIKTINGSDAIWSISNCKIDDKSHKALTFQLNAMFRKYGINQCIQKMAFLAMTSVETGFFQTTSEIYGDSNSSKYKYKGRGILQLTGHENEPVIYKDYQKTLGASYDIITQPDLVAEKLYLAIDCGGWIWSKAIKTLSWQHRKTDSRDKSQADYEAKMKALKWRRENMPLGENKYLNEIALGMKENERMYLLLIARMMQGYFPDQTNEEPTSLHFQRRFDNYLKLKQWFKFDKTVCDSDLPELSGRAPWMDVALRELKLYGGKHENTITEVVKKYHKEGASLDAGSATAWCSSFVCWCLENSNPKYKSPHSAGSRMFLSNDSVEKCEEAYFGAIAVFSDCNSDGTTLYDSGHVTFIYGELTDKNNYVVLGGNQGNKISLSPYYYTHGKSFFMYKDEKGKKHYKIFRGFYKPKGYIIKDTDKLNNKDKYNSLKEVNDILNINHQEINANGESST